jgi:hypothetical protein
MTNSANGVRNGTADLLKGFAVIFMIQVHIMEQFATQELQQTVVGKLSMFLGGPACAPVFLAVMGYFLVSPDKSAFHYLKRGGILFVGGIILNIARSANLLIHIGNGEMNLDPWPFILGADILTLAGISLLFVAILRMVFRKNGWAWLILAVGVVVAVPFLPTRAGDGSPVDYLLAFFRGPADWSYFPLFPWFGYVLLGYGFHLLAPRFVYLIKPNPNYIAIFLLPVAVGLVLTLPWVVGVTSNLKGNHGYYHHGVLFFLWIVGFVAVWLFTLNQAESNFGNYWIMRVLRWTGRKVTLIYIIQWLIIGNIATLLFGTQDLFRVALWIPGITLATLLLGLTYETFVRRFSPACK